MPETRKMPPLRKVIKELMDTRGLKSAELSKQTNLPQTTIRYILQGITDNPRIDTVMTLADFFDVSIEHLVTGGTSLRAVTSTTVGSVEPKTNVALKMIPILDWNNLKLWCVKGDEALSKEHSKWIPCNDLVSDDSFALEILYEGRGVFPKNCVIVVDPHKSYQIDDYVVASIKKNKPTLRRIWEESGELYLNSVGGNLPSEKLEPPHIVFGTIVESRLKF